MQTLWAACLENRNSSPKGIGISQQCYGLFDKLEEVDSTMTPSLQKRIFEVHPELCFMQMAKRPMRYSKKKPEGQKERLEWLHSFNDVIDDFKSKPHPGLGIDDLLDACAACWTAARIANKNARRVPAEPAVDSRGLRMEIWR